MAIYANLSDCTDPIVTVDEADLESADRAVEAILRGKGIDPAAVVEAGALAMLADLAATLAMARAANRRAVESDSPLWPKADSYRRAANEIAARLDRESLGLAAAGSGSAGYGPIPVGRA